MEFNENFILGCSAIGAGLAVIAGIGPGCLVRRLPRQPVCMVC